MNGLIYEQTNWQGNMGDGRNFADITWIALALVLPLVHKKENLPPLLIYYLIQQHFQMIRARTSDF